MQFSRNKIYLSLRLPLNFLLGRSSRLLGAAVAVMASPSLLSAFLLRGLLVIVGAVLHSRAMEDDVRMSSP